ncbi:MAG: TolC family protein [Bacteroidota bacterium]
MFRLFFSLILLFFSVLHAQTLQHWTLQQCIEYALVNNIQIKQNLLNVELSEAVLLQSKAQLLPSLNGNVSHNYNYGKKVDPFTNQFLSGNWMLSQDFSLSANATLFDGFQNLNTIKQNQYDLMASCSDVDKMRNDISLNIVSAYLQILFADELLTVAKSQIEITRLQTERIKKLVTAEIFPRGNLLDIEAQFASEELNMVNAENNLTLSYLNLVQILNLNTVVNFKIVRPEINMSAEPILNNNTIEIYNNALTTQPEIKSAEFRLKSSEKSLSVAKGGIYPRISLFAYYGTGYSEASKGLSGTPGVFGYIPNGDITSAGDTVYSPQMLYNYSTIPFSEQINQNLNRSVGLHLSVPIFNNLQNKTSVVRAKISIENAKLSLQLVKDNLQKKIQQAYNDAVASLKKYHAADKAVTAIEEAFKYTEQKFNVGTITATDYGEAKNKLFKAKSELLQAKYDYVFKLKVLDFYQRKPITL